MSETTTSDCLTREEQIKGLIDFTSDLAAAVRHQKKGDAQAALAASEMISAECTVCKLQISGPELFKVGEPPEAPEASGPVKRLRLGYCAHAGCESYAYRILFRNGAGMDWSAVTAHMAELAAARKIATTVGSEEGRRKLLAARWKLAGRIALGVGAILVVLAIRQWYFGGTIPLIREPEKFQVGTVPAGDKVHH